MPGQAATSGRSRRQRSSLTVLLDAARSPSPSAANAIALQANRSGLVREEFAFVLLLVVPSLLLTAGCVVAYPQDPRGWLMLAIFVPLWAFAFAGKILVWLRRIPPVVVDPIAIDLQGTGPVPWGEIRAVVIDRRRLWLELNRDTAAFVAARAFPPWFTTAHENLLGDAAWIAPGHIHVSLRWIDATPEEIATQIRRFATVPVRMKVSAAANAS